MRACVRARVCVCVSIHVCVRTCVHASMQLTNLKVGAGDTLCQLSEERLLHLDKLGGVNYVQNLLHLPKIHHLEEEEEGGGRGGQRAEEKLRRGGGGGGENNYRCTRICMHIYVTHTMPCSYRSLPWGCLSWASI